MPTLAVVGFNIVCATLGGFIAVFGLVSYLLKERFYLSESCKQTPFSFLLARDEANYLPSDITCCRRHILTRCHQPHPTA